MNAATCLSANFLCFACHRCGFSLRVSLVRARAPPGQVHCVAQRQFLPKDWIMEQWDAGYYITAIAGAPQGPGLRVGVGLDRGGFWQTL